MLTPIANEHYRCLERINYANNKNFHPRYINIHIYIYKFTIYKFLIAHKSVLYENDGYS